MTAPANLTSEGVATALDIDPKGSVCSSARTRPKACFTRDGKAYVFTKADVAKIKNAYAAFVADRPASNKANADDAPEDEVKASAGPARSGFSPALGGLFRVVAAVRR
jgi:hypothetical protein